MAARRRRRARTRTVTKVKKSTRLAHGKRVCKCRTVKRGR